MADGKQKRELTPAEELAYMKLAQAARELQEAQEAAEQLEPADEKANAVIPVNAGVTD